MLEQNTMRWTWLRIAVDLVADRRSEDGDRGLHGLLRHDRRAEHAQTLVGERRAVIDDVHAAHRLGHGVQV
jgi:hypothetical protein